MLHRSHVLLEVRNRRVSVQERQVEEELMQVRHGEAQDEQAEPVSK